MKTIGLIGGMSWESSVGYYQLINRGINQQLGGLHSAKLILNSVDFAEIETLQHQGNWDKTADILVDSAKSLQAAGADAFLICTNTMHLVADQVADAVDIPLLHIVDSVGAQLTSSKIKKAMLLGTQFTMQKPFYKQRLQQIFGIEVVVPNEQEQRFIHQVIYQELCKGEILAQSRQAFVNIIERLAHSGAQGAILGCTEIGLLVKPHDTDMPLFDTTGIHAETAVNFMLK